MQELLYGVDSVWIALALLVAMALAVVAGARVGARAGGATTEAFRSHVNTVAGSLLGVLALLLGFTLSLSLQRYDSRSEAVVTEANAIGTAWLRVALLPEPARAEMAGLLRDYADLRVQAATVSLADDTRRGPLLAQAAALQARLWDRATAAAAQTPNPVTTGLFVQALNDMFDAYGARTAALDRHVPELVLWLLCLTFVTAGAVVGYAAGVGGHRPAAATYAMIGLIVVLVFIILDLDRPRRGLIQVSQRPLIELQAGMHGSPAPARP